MITAKEARERFNRVNTKEAKIERLKNMFEEIINRAIDTDYLNSVSIRFDHALDGSGGGLRICFYRENVFGEMALVSYEGFENSIICSVLKQFEAVGYRIEQTNVMEYKTITISW